MASNRIQTRISYQELKEMRALTMACWWPSRIMGRKAPDWPGIAGELDALTNGAEQRYEMGTATYDEVLQLRKLRQLAKDKAR